MKIEQEGEEDNSTGEFKKRDELYSQAVDVVVNEQRGSVSLLQRSLGIGYGRAARLIDFMEEDGYVGPYNGSKSREVILTHEKWMTLQGQDTEEVDLPDDDAPTVPLQRIENLREHQLAASEALEVEEDVDEDQFYDEEEISNEDEDDGEGGAVDDYDDDFEGDYDEEHVDEEDEDEYFDEEEEEFDEEEFN